MIKKLFFVSSLLWMMVITANGQPQNRTPEERAKRQTDLIVEATGCDAATKAKVEVVSLKYAKEMSALFAKAQDRDAIREPLKELRDKQDAELKGVLTADQYAKYVAKQEEMRKARQGGGGGPR
jgi:Spy/CpxP family protein refolding chaperone